MIGKISETIKIAHWIKAHWKWWKYGAKQCAAIKFQLIQDENEDEKGRWKAHIMIRDEKLKVYCEVDDGSPFMANHRRFALNPKQRFSCPDLMWIQCHDLHRHRHSHWKWYCYARAWHAIQKSWANLFHIVCRYFLSSIHFSANSRLFRRIAIVFTAENDRAEEIFKQWLDWNTLRHEIHLKRFLWPIHLLLKWMFFEFYKTELERGREQCARGNEMNNLNIMHLNESIHIFAKEKEEKSLVFCLPSSIYFFLCSLKFAVTQLCSILI